MRRDLNNKYFSAVTLAEIVVVLGIFALMAAIAMPIGLSQLSSNNALQTARDLVSNISVMQQNAYNGRGTGEYGIVLFVDSYILYEGPDYLSALWSDSVQVTRADMDLIDFNSGNEIHFGLGTLFPTQDGHFRVGDDSQAYIVDINSEGMIDINRE